MLVGGTSGLPPTTTMARRAPASAARRVLSLPGYRSRLRKRDHFGARGARLGDRTSARSIAVAMRTIAAAVSPAAL